MISKNLSTFLVDATIFFLALPLSFLLTQGAYRFALRKNVLDIPNDRSSHSTPTPRGGGLGIVLTFLPGLLLLSHFGTISGALLAALLGGGSLIALVGWMDDLKPIAARWRFMIHAIAAGWAITWVGGVTGLTFGQYTVRLGFFGDLLTFFGILWMINLYNFMDGIDGLAAGEALSAGLTGGVLLVLGGESNLAGVAILLASCCAGFLILNWPPAKIFMGDIGSGFIGYCLAVLWIAGVKTNSATFWVWPILLSIFIVDATFTLIFRIMRGETWHQAHRTHAYQQLTQLGWPHLRVTGLVLFSNFFILFPLAWYSMRNSSHSPWILLSLFVLLFILWTRIRRKFAQARIAELRSGDTNI